MDAIIQSGRVIDPASNRDEVADILIENSKIKSIAKGIKPKSGADVIDAKGMIVVPGLVDMHCHLRDPGDPDDETIASGTRSAAKGGFTSIACMANTNPVIDNPAMVKYVVSKAKNEGVVNVYPIGAVTLKLEGKQLVEMGRMIAEGAIAFSDDGKPIVDAQVFRHALEYAKAFKVKIISHCEVGALSSGGQMNEGLMSTVLGLKGIPNIAEEVMVEREIKLAQEYGQVHITHVSTAGSVRLIRDAKRAGIKITCDTCPQYFSITDKAVDGYNTYAKVNPPLRSEKDVEEIIKGLKDGTIDAISTDHAPHKEEKKMIEFAQAASGMVGFETALSLALTELSGELKLSQIIEKMTVNPAHILGIKKGHIKEGYDADIVIIDPKAEYEINASAFASRSKNSPFNGRKVIGKIEATIVAGKIIVLNGELTS